MFRALRLIDIVLSLACGCFLVLLLEGRSVLSGAQTPPELERARALLQEARTETEKIEDFSTRNRLRGSVIAGQVKAGDLEAAERAFAEPGYLDAHGTTLVYGAIAANRARVGDFDGALAAAEKMKRAYPGEVMTAFLEIARREGEADRVSAALQLLGRSEVAWNARGVDETLAQIAAAQFKAGQHAVAAGLFQDALRRASELPPGASPVSSRGNTDGNGEQTAADLYGMTAVAKIQARAGDLVEARRVFAEVEQKIGDMDAPQARDAMFSTLGTALAVSGEIDWARKIIAQMKNPDRADDIRGWITQEYTSRKEYTAALRAARTIQAIARRAIALMGVAGARAANGDIRGAKMLFEEVLDMGPEIPPGWEATELAILGRCAAKVGFPEKAPGLFEQAIQSVGLIQVHPEQGRPQAIRLIARLRAEAGDLEGVIQMAKRFPETADYGEVWQALASNSACSRIIQWARTLPTGRARVSVLVSLAEGLLRSPDEEVRP